MLTTSYLRTTCAASLPQQSVLLRATATTIAEQASVVVQKSATQYERKKEIMTSVRHALKSKK